MLGRIIATLMGWMLLGPFGALLGFAAGFFFDKGLASIDTSPPRGKVDEAQQFFFLKKSNQTFYTYISFHYIICLSALQLHWCFIQILAALKKTVAKPITAKWMRCKSFIF